MLTGLARYLVLWDVDHTLIETRGFGLQQFMAAFEAVTGHPLVNRVTVTGRTEQAIFAEALRIHGIAELDQLRPRYLQELAAQYRDQADQLARQGRALPGAREALAALARVPGLVQSVLTGNVRAVAEVKLSAFDLDQYLDLDVGAYGEDSEDRPPLVAVARQRAGTAYDTAFYQHNTIIVGDTTNDVIAARRGGARIVAVATGSDSEAELRRAGARIVLPDLTDRSLLIDAIKQATTSHTAPRTTPGPPP